MALKKKRVAWNKGIPLSEETKKKLSEAHKGQKAWNKGLKGIYSKETQNKMNEGRKKAWENPELRKMQSELTKKGMADPKIRKKISDAKKGKPSWMKGKKPSKETIEKQKIAYRKTIESNPLVRKRLSEASNKRWGDSEYKRKTLKSQEGWLSNPENYKKRSDWSRKNILGLYESSSFPKQTDTKIEIAIRDELIRRGYKLGKDFVQQFRFMDKFSCDFCFPKQKVILEAYGDFWHANPKKYPDKSKLHKHQIKGVNRDKAKEAYIKKCDNGTWTYLYLWESDIEKDIIGCIDLIEKSLEKNKIQ